MVRRRRKTKWENFITPKTFEILGCAMIFPHSKSAPYLSTMEKIQQYNCIFGPLPPTIKIIWLRLEQNNLLPPNPLPKYLLWALAFLRTNMDEVSLSILTGTDRKTTRKWKWRFVYALSNLSSYVVSTMLYFKLYYFVTKKFICYSYLLCEQDIMAK